MPKKWTRPLELAARKKKDDAICGFTTRHRGLTLAPILAHLKT